MEMKQIYENYRAVEKTFCCPICHTRMHMQAPASILCKNGHCYDLSRDGYINFLPGQKATKYNAESFESRRAVFAGGYYILLAEEIGSLVKSLQKEGKLCLADAGCGEGYYDCFMQENLNNLEIFAFDSVKEAVRMGAKSNKGIRWFVGNLADIPICTGQADILLEIFAPANYAEFKRVIKKDGYILKVIPGRQYLKELRARIAGEEDMSYRSDPVEEYFSKNLKLTARRHLLYQKKVEPDMARHFLEMTPMMFGKSASDVDITGLESLTFEFILLLGRR